MSEHLKNPTARRENLLIEEVAGELLIYDVTKNRAHCLNESAATIWRHCDGTRSVDELAQHLFPTLDTSDSRRIVSLGIERLHRRKLLENLPTPAVDLSKRDLLKKVAVLATAAGIVAPLISSVMAPTSAYAMSCVPAGGACTAIVGECCGGLPCIGKICGG